MDASKAVWLCSVRLASEQSSSPRGNVYHQEGDSMRAVLMAGGSGTRLRPLTCDLPKPMVPILNRPIAEHIINLLKRNGITEVIATLYYLPDVMRKFVWLKLNK